MKREILVAGTGRMGKDVGLYFLRRGNEVTWVARNADGRDRFAARLDKEIRRLSRHLADADLPEKYRVTILRDLEDSQPDVFFECISEDLDSKKVLFHSLGRDLPDETLLFSASSSFLPGDIHGACIGGHVFYPLEMTAFAEIIIPVDHPAAKTRQAIDFFEKQGIEVLVEDSAGAFALNRLLLPLQDRSLGLLRLGFPAELVNNASKSALFPMGQLELMDHIGLDILSAAARRYAVHFPDPSGSEYRDLIKGLEELTTAGKRGRKNGDGLLMGAPLPWKETPRPGGKAVDLAFDFLSLALNACYHLVEREMLTLEELTRALEAVYGSRSSPAAALEKTGKPEVRSRLEGLFEEEGSPYFRPSSLLFGP